MTLAPLKLLVLPWFLLAGGARAQTQPSSPEGPLTSAGIEPPAETPGTSPPPGPETPASSPGPETSVSPPGPETPASPPGPETSASPPATSPGVLRQTPPGVDLEEGSSVQPLVTVSPEPLPDEEEPSWIESGGVNQHRLWSSSRLSEVCTCDLTPNSCDLNCCCDKECYLRDPRALFTFCLPGSYRAIEWRCVESSIIFRSNAPFRVRTLELEDGLKFCVQVNNPMLNYFQHLQKVDGTNMQSLVTEYGGTSFFSVPQSMPTFSSFYVAGDPILIYSPKWSLLSYFKQPIGIGPREVCTENNAARFLESGSTTCTRFFSNLTSSCTTDPLLRVTSYHNFMVLKVPKGVTDLENMQVPITLTSEPISPQLDGNTCLNVVSQVIYEIETNGTFGIQKVSLSFILMNLSGDPGASIQQHFTIHFHPFQHRRALLPLARSGNPGYIFGMPLLVLKGDSSVPMTISQSHSDGSCSVNRRKVEFGVNMMTGCKFREENRNCDHLQDEIYKTLSGTSSPVYLGIAGNSEPSHIGHWVKVFTKNCSALAKNCTSCCGIPFSLEIQILWAYVGLQSNPQAHVLGGRYLYECNFITLPSSVVEVSLRTFVSFTDITKKTEFTESLLKKDWIFPFSSFFQEESSGKMESLRSLSTPVVFCVCYYLAFSA
ncbi:LOW QUALITY PROTEIN: tectonic-3 [Trichosurus vulpecula]|uniref:LOW QUALITY PROTEIN: tectonic-3 n=1 Tax=Trichosurus vulpecula TaxID=9337 RepID=UPI00186AE98A|nr:LOW QUALITY PROTEIN: tectonic-3 [Trichosurus vulpecula]